MNSEPNVESISIGMPVYNGERFLEKKLNSLLSQTFSDFELIISDNASTDLTPEICKKFAKNDKRIRFFCQEKNMGANWNFNFVLEKANCPYFLWAGVNDTISESFLEKNFKILESKNNFVGSISKIKPAKKLANVHDNKPIDVFFKKLMTDLRSIKTIGSYNILGSYESKMRFYLKNSTCQLIYGLFRTEQLRKSLVQKSFIGNDWATMLNVLRFGDFHVVDDDIMFEHQEGLSSTGLVNISNLYNHGTWGLIFPWYPFTSWCFKNLERKFIIKNLDFFIQLNLEGIFSLSLDGLRLALIRMYKKSESA